MKQLLVVTCLALLMPTFVLAAFERDLFFGLRGDDVKELQQFLKDQGPGIYPEGLVTGFFGSLTREAVKLFQAFHKITPVAGYFGPKTRKAVNELLKKAPVKTPTPAAVPIPAPTPAPTPPPSLRDTKKPTFLKTPRANLKFFEVQIVDADVDEPVGYTLVCDRTILPALGGGLLTFRVKPHLHYNCQLTAEDAGGNTSVKELSFDTQEWFELSAFRATSTPQLEFDLGTLTLANNSAKIANVISLPVKFSWLFLAGSPNVGARLSILLRTPNRATIGRNDFILNAAEKIIDLKLNTGQLQLQADQSIELILGIENLAGGLRSGEFLKVESASTTAPAELSLPLNQVGSFIFHHAP